MQDDFVRSKNARWEKAEEDAQKYRLALESLTPKGSEYHRDIERCIGYVKERMADGHRAKLDRVELKNLVHDLRDVVNKLRADLFYQLITTVCTEKEAASYPSIVLAEAAIVNIDELVKKLRGP